MNYGALKTLANQYLEVDETTFNANIGQFVRLAEEDIFRQVQLQELMETSTAQVVTGSPYLALPADFLSAYSLAIMVSGEYRMLLSKDHSFMREVYPNPDVLGVPRFYALFDDETLMLGPAPNDDYSVELNYFYEPPSLTEGDDDNNTTWLSENGEQALLFGTLLQGYIYLKGDQDVVAQYQNQYQTALAALKIIAEGRNRKDSYRKSDRRIPV